MAWKYIPLPTSDQTLLETTPTLDGESFSFLFDWNSREDRWTLTISDVNQTAIVAGVKLVPSFPLLRNVSSDNRPKGSMFIMVPGDVEVTRTTIEEARLVYVPEADLT